MLHENLTTTGVYAHVQAFELSIQATIGDKVIDKAIDKSLGLEKIHIEDLLELHSFNKNEYLPFE